KEYMDNNRKKNREKPNEYQHLHEEGILSTQSPEMHKPPLASQQQIMSKLTRQSKRILDFEQEKTSFDEESSDHESTAISVLGEAADVYGAQNGVGYFFYKSIFIL